MKIHFPLHAVSLIVMVATGVQYAFAGDDRTTSSEVSLEVARIETARDDRSTVEASRADASARLAGPHMHNRLSSIPVLLALGACGSGGTLTGGGGNPPPAVEVTPASSTINAAVPTSNPLPGITCYVMNTGSTGVPMTCTADVPWLMISNFEPGILQPTDSRVCTASLMTVQVAMLPAGSHTGHILFESGGVTVGSHTVSLSLTSTQFGTQMTTANRVSGVAPLGVVFDASGASSGVVQPAGPSPNYGSHSYTWSFGDPAEGNWSHGGGSKNASTGWIAGHVFNSPGSYRVTLKVIDPTGAEHDYYQDITVTDPETVFAGRTFYVADTGNDVGPGTMAQPFRTVGRGLTAAFGSAPGRVLLRRGDTFAAPSLATANSASGPFLIGSYGTGNRPRINSTNISGGFSFTPSPDVRLVGIDLYATGTGMEAWAAGVAVGPTTLVSRCRLDGFGYAMSVGNYNGVVAHETEMLNSGSYGTYASGTDLKHLAILGCRYDQAGQHLLRTYTRNTVVQATLFQRTYFHAMKLCGITMANPSRNVCVIGNVFETTTAQIITIGPENQVSTSQLAVGYLLDGNRFIPQSGGGCCINIWGRSVTVQNNIFDLPNGRQAIHVTPAWGVGPMPSDIWIRHNTAYRAAGSPLEFCAVTASNPAIVEGNILYCPGGTANVNGSVTSSHNHIGNPQFVNAAAGDFNLLPGSPAIDAAALSPARIDYHIRRRNVGSAPDIGAIERQ